MSEEKAYQLDAEEANFARIVSLEITTIQLMRELLLSRPVNERSFLLEKLKRESNYINNHLNQSGSGRDLAWKSEMSDTFALIYNAAAAEVDFGADKS